MGRVTSHWGRTVGGVWPKSKHTRADEREAARELPLGHATRQQYTQAMCDFSRRSGRSPEQPEWPQEHADHIAKDDPRIGISSGTIYSYWFREVLSMGCIDVEASEIGTGVVVQWGDCGGKLNDVRVRSHASRA